MQDIKENIEAFLTPLLEGTDMFITDIRVRPVHNIQVFIDADSGMPIEKTTRIHKRLYAAIEASDQFPDGDFSLEVSSPGVDEPLGSLRQYHKNIGRTVSVNTKEPPEEITGVLKSVTDTDILLEIKQPKQKPALERTIPFINIQQTIVQIVF